MPCASSVRMRNSDTPTPPIFFFSSKLTRILCVAAEAFKQRRHPGTIGGRSRQGVRAGGERPPGGWPGACRGPTGGQGEDGGHGLKSVKNAFA